MIALKMFSKHSFLYNCQRKRVLYYLNTAGIRSELSCSATMTTRSDVISTAPHSRHHHASEMTCLVTAVGGSWILHWWRPPPFPLHFNYSFGFFRFLIWSNLPPGGDQPTAFLFTQALKDLIVWRPLAQGDLLQAHLLNSLFWVSAMTKP